MLRNLRMHTKTLLPLVRLSLVATHLRCILEKIISASSSSIDVFILSNLLDDMCKKFNNYNTNRDFFKFFNFHLYAHQLLGF